MKYLLLIALTGCGITIHHDPIEPIIIKYQIDLSSVEPYCQKQCVDNIDVAKCNRDCINGIIGILGALAAK